MPKSWTNALHSYFYCADLYRYRNAHKYPKYFKSKSADRQSTAIFEDRFRSKCGSELEVWYEVTFWKMYSMKGRGQYQTDEAIQKILTAKNTAKCLTLLADDFISHWSDPIRLNALRAGLGMISKAKVMALPLTFVSFRDPYNFPMIDTVSARWINKHLLAHNRPGRPQLTKFATVKRTKSGYSVVRHPDMQSYIHWVDWCRWVRDRLNSSGDTGIDWRARDVEMAVFTAQQDGLALNVL
ncbi:MAG: hypothetical protein KIT79_09680 [Deltaproteobacteria bacterium]|nr:hypothetical protein [Deltaproteobacteria bacterium]